MKQVIFKHHGFPVGSLGREFVFQEITETMTCITKYFAGLESISLLLFKRTKFQLEIIYCHVLDQE